MNGRDLRPSGGEDPRATRCRPSPRPTTRTRRSVVRHGSATAAASSSPRAQQHDAFIRCAATGCLHDGRRATLLPRRRRSRHARRGRARHFACARPKKLTTTRPRRSNVDPRRLLRAWLQPPDTSSTVSGGGFDTSSVSAFAPPASSAPQASARSAAGWRTATGSASMSSAASRSRVRRNTLRGRHNHPWRVRESGRRTRRSAGFDAGGKARAGQALGDTACSRRGWSSLRGQDPGRGRFRSDSRSVFGVLAGFAAASGAVPPQPRPPGKTRASRYNAG